MKKSPDCVYYNRNTFDCTNSKAYRKFLFLVFNSCKMKYNKTCKYQKKHKRPENIFHGTGD